jgi:hypothetical protein
MEGAVVLTEDIDIILQQVDILLDTRRGEILGDYEHGTELSKYLFDPNIGPAAIEDELRSYISDNVEMFGWSFDVKVEFLMGTLNDIILLNIIIYNDKESYTKTYKVSEGSSEY